MRKALGAQSAAGTAVPGSSSIIQDVIEFFGENVVAELGFEILTTRLNNYQADGSLTSSDMERLNHEIDMLLEAATTLE